MSLEKNELAVEEVITFSKKCNFLFGDVCPKGLFVNSVEEIPEDFTHSGHEGKSYNDLSGEELTFSGIKSEEFMVVSKELEQDRNKRSLAGHARRVLMGKAGILPEITKKLPGKYIKEACDEIILEDLLCCAQWRAAFGIKEGFWETIFQIYKSGGMPVGWSGKYPDGKLMAIHPNNSPTH